MTTPNFEPLPIATVICGIAFPALRAIWSRTRRGRRFNTGEFVRMTVTGAGVPQAACLAFWPIWPPLLAAATDLPLLLVPTGIISLYVSFGSIFDLD